MRMQIHNSNCLDVMRGMDANSIDAIVTDPPYGLRFMGKKWDYDVPSLDVWKEALRVAKPGAHLLCFGGSRTYHRMTCAIEDAGWDIRDCIMWVYGSGFPKSMDVSKAIDKKMGAKREVVGHSDNGSGPWNIKLKNHGKGDTGIGMMDGSGKSFDITAPATEAAKQWNGYGTSLKPAFEPVIVARKPLDGTVADTVLKWGTGAINIDGCRVPTEENITNHSRSEEAGKSKGIYGSSHAQDTHKTHGQALGRFPANLVHDGSEEVLACFPDAGGSDKGSAARFFYCAKASRSERGEGNGHPTVKPLALMKYLVTLVAPPNAVVLDSYMGSGTTGVAALQLGRKFVGIERDSEYFRIAKARMEGAELPLFASADRGE